MNANMVTDLFTPIVALGTAMVGPGGAIVGITKYFNYRSERDKIRLIGDAFEAAIVSLRSDNAVERMAGAVRLRRFYDPKREMEQEGRRHMPRSPSMWQLRSCEVNERVIFKSYWQMAWDLQQT